MIRRFALLFALAFTLAAGVMCVRRLYATPLETIEGLALGDQAVVPIIMYHALEAAPSNKWEITTADFESDLKYLAQHGYTAVVMQDLIDFVHNGRPLPDKPIVLSFDDGRSPTITIITELLTKYNAKASMAIIGAETDKYTHIKKTKKIKKNPHMTWEEVQTAAQSGVIEISSHTYDLHGHNGAKKRRGESEGAYRKRFLADLQKFAEVLHENADLAANTLVYPLGAISPMSDDIIREAGYLASLSCNEKSNMLVVGDYDCLYSLNRYLRPPHRSSADFFGRILSNE